MIMTGLQDWSTKKQGLQRRRPGRRTLYRQKSYKNEYQDEDLESEEDIDENELAYLEEDIKSNDYNTYNEEKDAPIQENK